ncbi:MAG: hypothetical protein ACYC7E_18935 [Armatimonadota bacterium]
MTLSDVIYWQDNLHIALALIIPPWLYFRLRAAGVYIGALYLWQVGLYAEMGLPAVATSVHEWHGDFLLFWRFWGWLAALVYLFLWYGFIRGLEKLWYTRLEPMPPTPDVLRLRPVERVGVILTLCYLFLVVGVLFWLQ